MFVCILTNSFPRCEAGRPNWQTLLEQICQRRKVIFVIFVATIFIFVIFVATILSGFTKIFPQGDLSLFYCGSPLAAKVIQPICDRLQIYFSKEIF